MPPITSSNLYLLGFVLVIPLIIWYFRSRNKKAPDSQQQVTKAITQLENSNRSLIHVAHMFAFALIIATSVASLISLAADLVVKVIAGHGTIASDASVVITLLLVMAMDVGMVLAARYISIGLQRGETLKQQTGHILVMCCVAALEAGTYIYMLYIYETPHNSTAWTLIVARGIAVPMLSLYLSLAQKITINTEDIARMTEVFSGVGVLRDVATIANDPNLDLATKIDVYRSAATLSESQRARLDGMYKAVGGHATTPMIDAPQQPPQGPSRAFLPMPRGDWAPDEWEETLRDNDGVWTPYEAELLEYVLPNGATLTTEDSMKQIAKLLGVGADNLYSAWPRNFTFHTHKGESGKFIAVWQVLALVEMGLLEDPTHAHKRHTANGHNHN